MGFWSELGKNMLDKSMNAKEIADSEYEYKSDWELMEIAKEVKSGRKHLSTEHSMALRYVLKNRGLIRE